MCWYVVSLLQFLVRSYCTGGTASSFQVGWSHCITLMTEAPIRSPALSYHLKSQWAAQWDNHLNLQRQVSMIVSDFYFWMKNDNPSISLLWGSLETHQPRKSHPRNNQCNSPGESLPETHKEGVRLKLTMRLDFKMVCPPQLWPNESSLRRWQRCVIDADGCATFEIPKSFNREEEKWNSGKAPWKCSQFKLLHN